MTFEQYMEKTWPDLWSTWLKQGQGDCNVGGTTVSVFFLRKLYEDARTTAMFHDVLPSTGEAGPLNPSDMKFVSKRWGWELWIVNNDRYCGKKLFVKKGHWLSFHHHAVKDEVLFVENGSVWFIFEQDGELKYVKMKAGQAFHVTPGMKHQVVATEDVTIFEFSTEHDDADSIRSTMDLKIPALGPSYAGPQPVTYNPVKEKSWDHWIRPDVNFRSGHEDIGV
jgi:mannose-6-phosphate isomerase-like protein (cupin superfamily)